MMTSLTPAARLRQHFSSRVINQVRQLLDIWRRLPDQQWSKEAMNDFILATEKLARFAQRFEAERHESIARAMLLILQEIRPGRSPNTEQLEQLNHHVLLLSQTALRHTDDDNPERLIPSKKPIYVALADTDNALTMAEQMQYFGLLPELKATTQDFVDSLQQRHPAAIVMDIDFGGSGAGIELANRVQQSRDIALPILFTFRQSAPTIVERLNAMRHGGVGMYSDTEVQSVIGHLENMLDHSPQPPYKILIVDDSRAQAMHAANVLNKAGMLSQVSNDPLQVLDAMASFGPDLVLMDMYMPECNGMELARVIRQQKEFLNLPIIYLSGEDDRERQLEAMAEGGDDFLTKPVEPGHLLTTIRTRVERARQLYRLISRDSLTGLLNHTHMLETLQDHINRQSGQPLSFVMVDIDHFKNINDTHGHPVGDVVIKNLALFLRQNLRKSDPIGRYGGEEFAVLLQDADERQAFAVMDKVRTNFANLIHGGLRELQVTFSCGVAQWSGESAASLVERADQALYCAKRGGRNQVSMAGKAGESEPDSA
ncbi:diguanylate cyclase response regulator [Bacterioplanes sanyensis]|uniref:diguanylate cyclase n=1 Tax=Bacterioplanes sanyensis TaxID=1249553 RepID=A0A222FL49_9GAMM|nr:diguanylate cyclase [Bacterioplanes sanyensis]ASP38943.1 diguanylate cyclase response regulator [Bacterioplanes sanyensis]